MNGAGQVWAVALSESAWEGPLVGSLIASAWAGIEVRRCVDPTELVALAASGRIGGAVVDPAFPRLGAETVTRLRGSGCAVVGVFVEDPAEELAGRLGITTCVRLDPSDCAPAAARIVDALMTDSLMADAASGAPIGHLKASASAARPRGPVIAVWGPPGAPGRTTITLGLARLAADRGVRTMVIDADSRCPGVEAALGIDCASAGLAAAASLADRGGLTYEALARQARAVAPGLRVLAGLGGGVPEIAWAGLAAVLRCASELDELVLVDIGSTLEPEEGVLFDHMIPRRDAAALAGANGADVCVAVTSCEPVALSRMLSRLPDLVAATSAPVIPVVNRHRRTLGRSCDERQINGLLSGAGLPAASFVPEAGPTMDLAVRRHQLPTEVAPKSDFARALVDLLGRLQAATLDRASQPSPVAPCPGGG